MDQGIKGDIFAGELGVFKDGKRLRGILRRNPLLQAEKGPLPGIEQRPFCDEALRLFAAATARSNESKGTQAREQAERGRFGNCQP